MAEGGARRGLGLIELLALVAFLAIALGLAVSVARHVRSTSAQEATQARLATLVEVARLYSHDFGGQLPAVEPSASATVDGPAFRNWVRQQNQRVLAAFLTWQGSASSAGSDIAVGQVSLKQSDALPLPGPRVDASLLVDVWGSPIALMPRSHTRIGLSPGNGPFFFSAGPDRDYLTLSDNLYSYEVTGLLPAAAPTTNRGVGQ
jgi:type II secretory pathway pseudopilin PulG